MKRVFSLLLMLSVMLSLSFGVSYASDSYVYAITNMTWAEFYAGEVGKTSADLLSSGLDAISTPTTHGLARFPLLLGESGDNGTTITGLKAVQVRMTQDVYDSLADNSRFTVSTASFDEYKDVNADGSFGKMISESTDAAESGAIVSLATGSSARWGHYVFSVSSADITIGSANRLCDYYLGALLETSDGEIYGMRHDNNLWSNTDIAFTVNENYVEPHGFGTKRFPEYTKNLAGKTVTKITYMLKDHPDVVLSNLNIYLKELTSADVSVSGDIKTGANIPVNLVFSDVPNEAGYVISSVTFLKEGGNRRTDTQTLTSADYSYSGNVLTLNECKAGTYTATFTSEFYADISASFTANDYYATTNMTWAEFYAGEVGETSANLLSAGLDVVSSPTSRIANNFTQLTSESNDIGGRNITGVKDVHVRMTGDVYNLLSNDSRYTFSSDTFAEYKAVNADGSFGKMATETQEVSDAVITVSAPGTWGDYVLDIESIDVTLGSGDRDARYYLGALVETSDGKIYGMRHNNNLWFQAKDLAISVKEFVEPHGVSRGYQYTSDMAGKTITKITYMLKDNPDVVLSVDVFLKNQTSADVSVSGSVKTGANIPVNLTFAGVPNDANYSLSSVTFIPEGGNRRNRQTLTSADYSYSAGVLTIANSKSGTYTATFSDEKYANISASFTTSDYYATTNMTWAEFYAGETGQTASELLSAGLDAVSSPTARVATRFTQLVSVSNDLGGRSITGVKDVHVRIPGEVYDSITDKSRYTLSDTAFTQYKTVNADGAFSAMVTESEDISGAIVTLSSGASSTWGSYMLNITSIDITLSSGDENYYLGALAETSDGKIYGLRHNNNLWFSAGNIAFTVNGNYSEPHGVSRDYAYTSDLPGKTITRITYLLKDQPAKVLDCNIYLKPISTAAVSPSAEIYSGNNVPVAFTFGNLPSGVTYTLKALYSGTGRGRKAITDYTYANNTLTVNGSLPAGRYQAIFETENYSDIGVVFTVEESYHYATTNMTWAEFYAGELGESSADLYAAGLDAISSPTSRVATRFTQLTSESNDLGGRSITGVAAVQVRMNDTVYNTLNNDTRYTFSTDSFDEYKEVSADGSFGAMLTEYHTQEGATVSLTAPAVWGDYLLDVESIDITLGSGDTRYYLGALVETSDGKIYAMRHNNNLWFNAKDLAISTAEFVEVHGVSRSYKYTSDMEGKTIKKITYMLKNLPDEIISCDVFLKLKTSASVSPVYDDGYHAVMAGQNVEIPLSFSNVPSSADYSLSGVTFGTGRGRKAVTGCTFSGDVLTISGDVSEGVYTATFSDETYANISATINVFTTVATDKIISADKNAAGLMFLLTPQGVNDSTDAVLTAQNFVNATEYTSVDVNFTENFTGASMIADSGFTLDVTLNGVPSGKRGILGFSKNLEITPAKIGSEKYSAMSAKILALPDVAYGWRLATPEQLRNMGLAVVGVYPDGVSRDITGYISSGIRVDDSTITFTYGTVLIDREFTPSEEGKIYALSDEGEGTMSDGAYDGKITATWYVMTPANTPTPTPASDDTRPTPTPASDDTRPTPTPTPASGDTTPTPAPTPGTSSGTIIPGRPAISLTDSRKADIRQALSLQSEKVSGATEVTELPSTAIKGTQTAASSDSVIYLPVLEVSEDKVYVFGVSLDKFAVNSPIFWNSNAVSISTGEFVSAADDEEAVIIMNDSGNEVATVPSNKHVNVAAYLEADKTYYPTITTASSGSETQTPIIGVGSSSGGCNFGIPAMLLGLCFIIALKK